MSKSTKLLTTTEYADKINKSRQGVLKSAKKQRLDLLPGVKKITQVGKYYLLEVPCNFSFPKS